MIVQTFITGVLSIWAYVIILRIIGYYREKNAKDKRGRYPKFPWTSWGGEYKCDRPNQCSLDVNPTVAGYYWEVTRFPEGVVRSGEAKHLVEAQCDAEDAYWEQVLR